MSRKTASSDNTVVDVQLVSLDDARELQHRAGLSLRPTSKVMDDYIARVPYAVAIVDSWRFRFPVTVVTEEEFAAMQERSAVYCG